MCPMVRAAEGDNARLLEEGEDAMSRHFDHFWTERRNLCSGSGGSGAEARRTFPP